MDIKDVSLHFFGIFLFLFTGNGFGQTCLEVFEGHIHCASQGDVEIVCPINSYVIIGAAIGKKMSSETCEDTPEAAEAACDLGTTFRWYTQNACHSNHICTIATSLFDTSQSDDCPATAFPGDNAFNYFFNCEPATIPILTMDSGLMTSGSHAIVASHTNANKEESQSEVTFESSAFACSVKLPANRQLLIHKESFYENEIEKNCDQRIWVFNDDNEDFGYICNQLGIPVQMWIPCKDIPQNVYLVYESDDISVQVSFTIKLSISHTSGFTIECGIENNTLPYPKSIMTSTVATTNIATTTQEFEHTSVEETTISPTTAETTLASVTVEDDSKISLAMLIGIGVGAALFCIIFLIIIIIICRKKSRKKTKETNASPPHVDTLTMPSSGKKEHVYSEPSYILPLNDSGAISGFDPPDPMSFSQPIPKNTNSSVDSKIDRNHVTNDNEPSANFTRMNNTEFPVKNSNPRRANLDNSHIYVIEGEEVPNTKRNPNPRMSPEPIRRYRKDNFVDQTERYSKSHSRDNDRRGHSKKEERRRGRKHNDPFEDYREEKRRNKYREEHGRGWGGEFPPRTNDRRDMHFNHDAYYAPRSNRHERFENKQYRTQTGAFHNPLFGREEDIRYVY